MAELERNEHGDEGRAREWMARAVYAAPDPAWTADGYVSDRWLPVSPITGRLDAFEWRVPLSGMLSVPVIEPEPQREPPEPGAGGREEASAAPNRPLEKSEPPVPSGGGEPPTPRRSRRPQAPSAVIPLVHAPDDPGPDTLEQEEAPPTDPNGGNWRQGG